MSVLVVPQKTPRNNSCRFSCLRVLAYGRSTANAFELPQAVGVRRLPKRLVSERFCRQRFISTGWLLGTPECPADPLTGEILTQAFQAIQSISPLRQSERAD